MIRKLTTITGDTIDKTKAGKYEKKQKTCSTILLLKIKIKYNSLNSAFLKQIKAKFLPIIEK